jgi:hypothetical protein
MNNPFCRRNLFVSILVLAVAIGGVALLIHQHVVPAAVPFANLDLQTALNVLGGLFVVSLMTERAIEVIISILRDADAQEIDGAIKTITAGLADANAKMPKDQAVIDAITLELANAQKTLDAYRIQTKEITYCISFSLGVAMAMVGVRGLHGLLQTGPASGWFSLVDIVVTGAVIAGGSDGIHQMINAILDVFSMVSNQAAKKSAS